MDGNSVANDDVRGRAVERLARGEVVIVDSYDLGEPETLKGFGGNSEQDLGRWIGVRVIDESGRGRGDSGASWGSGIVS